MSRTSSALRMVIVALTCGSLLASCFKDDGGARAVDLEIRRLEPLSFKAAGGTCEPSDCASAEAGFAYAKRTKVAYPGDCTGKGNADYVQGCELYADDLVEAAKRSRGGI